MFTECSTNDLKKERKKKDRDFDSSENKNNYYKV